MDSLARALLFAISHIERRDVPDDVADDDVAALEEISFHLRQCSISEREHLILAARLLSSASNEPRIQQSMDAIIENLQP